MTPYKPLYIRGVETGLVQNRQEFILPDDAYPTLTNMFVWREQLRRRPGLKFLGRLRRKFFDVDAGVSGVSSWSFNIFTQASISKVTEPNAQIAPGSLIVNLNDSSSTGAVTGYTRASDVTVTATGHGLSNGTEIEISGVTVVDGTGPETINGQWTINSVTTNTFNLQVDSHNWGEFSGAGIWTTITAGAQQLIDQGNGILATSPATSTEGTIDYLSGSVTISNGTVGVSTSINFNYFPNLPVMGIRTQEVAAVNNENTIVFDTTYAYQIVSSEISELPNSGTTWSGGNANFFWTTNYWVNSSNQKLFWVTNFSGSSGDPIRYYDTTTQSWTDFTPTINTAGDVVAQSLAILPFRGRLLLFNTLEGTNLSASTAYYQRIRWSAIGSPLVADSWRDDLRGKGGFLDIPTSENITSVGFVRDNLVIYCERSTWQLRYTGRSIAPFQIERVNSELGAASTFSAVQFDTSLVGIGDKGIVECDSSKSNRIDIKIPDLVFSFSNRDEGTARIQGIRDIQQRLAFWTYVDQSAANEAIASGGVGVYPNRRLVYNYENDSWAIFTDSITALGTYQPTKSITWAAATYPWTTSNFPWASREFLFPALIGGNQQGFLFYLGGNLEPLVSNQQTLTITAITGNDTTATKITSPSHNMVNGQVISISGIPLGTGYASTLNNPRKGIITAATQANPCQITSTGNGLANGDIVEIASVVGMTELNTNTYTVTVVDANNFTIGVDSTAFAAYVSGGTWTDQSITCFGVVVNDLDSFFIYTYDAATEQFSIPQTNSSALTYPGGGGVVSLRDGIDVVSKKFNFLDQGQNIQIGYLDMLMSATTSGAITMNVYMDYNNNQPVNELPENVSLVDGNADEFFNTIIPTSKTEVNSVTGSKYMNQVYCPVRAVFITIQFTLSKAQLVGVEQESNVQIDTQVIWMRPAGRLGN